MHKASGTCILPGYWWLVDYKADGCSESKTVTCKVLEHKANYWMVFHICMSDCGAAGSCAVSACVRASTPGQVLARFLGSIGIDVKTYKRSGLDLLGITRKDVQISSHSALNL